MSPIIDGRVGITENSGRFTVLEWAPVVNRCELRRCRASGLAILNHSHYRIRKPLWISPMECLHE